MHERAAGLVCGLEKVVFQAHSLRHLIFQQ